MLACLNFGCRAEKEEHGWLRVRFRCNVRECGRFGVGLRSSGHRFCIARQSKPTMDTLQSRDLVPMYVLLTNAAQCTLSEGIC